MFDCLYICFPILTCRVLFTLYPWYNRVGQEVAHSIHSHCVVTTPCGHEHSLTLDANNRARIITHHPHNTG